MGTLEGEGLSLGLGSFCIIFQLFLMRWRLWKYPLEHGPGFLMGVKVQPGFYDGPGIQWLRRYHALLLAVHAVMVFAFATLVISHRWNDMPIMAPIIVGLMFGMLGGFTLWTRLTLGTTPPKFSSVAIPFGRRRLSDYISWPLEGLMGGLLVASWLLLLFHGDAEFQWGLPVCASYVVLGLLPGKIILVRNSYPLPPERTEEHQRWLEANRRYAIRVMDTMRWFIVVILCRYALIHGFPALSTVWVARVTFGISVALILLMLALLIHGSRRLTAMGRNLLPIGSWSGPFRPARLMLPGGLNWSVVYCAGLILLLVLFLH